MIEVPNYTVHEWHRAEGVEHRENLIVREWTVPEDGRKEVFFRNLNSFLMEPQPSSMYEMSGVVPGLVRSWIESWIILLQLFCIFRAWDNWPLFIGDDSRMLSWIVTHLVLNICSAIGWFVGLGASYPEYVNKDLLSRATRKSSAKKTR